MVLGAEMRRLLALRRRWTAPVRARVLDALIALSWVAIVLIEMSDEPLSGQIVIGAPIALAQGMVLLVRRTRPVPVLVAVVAVDAVGWTMLQDVAFDIVSLPGLVALYSAGKYRPYKIGWIAGTSVTAVIGVCYLIRPESEIKDEIPNLIVVFLTAVLGMYLRLRREMAERARTQRATEAVHAERRRIARELHDVVAHHISVMNVLVGAARTTMTIDADRAQEALATTERTAREALAEMRQLLAVLRADDVAEDPEPGARTSKLPDLVGRARAAGVSAELRVVGEPRPLPAAVDLAVYRTVQEALTNAHKHAFGSRACIRLRYEYAAVDIEVIDDGPGVPASTAPGDGYGLRGMAERVSLCGGVLKAGPQPGRGFRVHARIPLPLPREPVTAEEGAP